MTKLADYDPASNNGNWQRVASTGADSQPISEFSILGLNPKNMTRMQLILNSGFRNLRMFRQSVFIHGMNAAKKRTVKKLISSIVDYKEQRDKALKMYKAVV